MMNDESLGQSLSQDAISNLYAMLLDLAPYVDRALPFIHRANAPPIAAKIKRCLSDLNNKVAPKRPRISEGSGAVSGTNDEQGQELKEGGGTDEEPEQAGLAQRKRGVSVLPLKPICLLIPLQKAALTILQTKKSNQIIAQSTKRREARTPIQFVFEWQGENNGTRREFEGLMRIVAGYVPIDLLDAAESGKLVRTCVISSLLHLPCRRET